MVNILWLTYKAYDETIQLFSNPSLRCRRIIQSIEMLILAYDCVLVLFYAKRIHSFPILFIGIVIRMSFYIQAVLQS